MTDVWVRSPICEWNTKTKKHLFVASAKLNGENRIKFCIYCYRQRKI